MENANETQEELPSSVLGTLDYWESTYTTDFENYEDHNDIGKVWFGNGNSSTVVKFISTRLNLSKEADRIIDLGCGNGWTCLQLAKFGFKKVTGVDYSSKAIELAKEIALKEGFTPEYYVCDMVDSDNKAEGFTFKLAHDKGTYDAISLCPSPNTKEKRQKYIKNVHSIIEEKGFFVIISCNWTKEELIEHFQNYFEFSQQIPTKSFSFGGQTGNTVTILVFIKK